MSTALIGAGIAAAGSVSSAAMTSGGNRKAARIAAQHNYEQWQREIAYNHPSQQMARMKEAGLNPNLIYGTGASGAAGNSSVSSPRMEVPAYQAPDIVGAMLPALQAYSDFRVKRAQTNNLEKQNDLIGAQAITEAAKSLNIVQQTAESAARTARSKFDLGMAENLKQNSLDVAQQTLLNMRKDMELKGVESLLKYEDLKYAPIRRGIGEETILNMRQGRQEKFYDIAIKKWEAELAKKGLTRSDSVLLRQMFSDSSAGKSVLSNFVPTRAKAGQLWNMVKKDPKSAWQSAKVLHRYFNNY